MLTLSDAILQEEISGVQQLLHYRCEEINQLDPYGFTPLIEAAIVDNIEISRLLLTQGADPNQQDVTGGTALQWAAENHNQVLCQLLLDHQANPNAYNFAGQPVLVMPTLRRQAAIRQCLIKGGADPLFAQDYINVKLLGHLFELVGTANIVSPNNQFVEVDFEGFFLEVTTGLITNSLVEFQNHYAARQLRRYAGMVHYIVEALQRASELIKYQQYRTDLKKQQKQINALIEQEPLVIPVGYEGHAITFIKLGNILVKCDRREDSRLYDNVMLYYVKNMKALTTNFIKSLIFEKQPSEFINNELPDILGLEPLTELKVASQISGNCSWANVEAVIPALFFLLLIPVSKDDQSHAYHKTLALSFFQRWREWNKERALQFCIQSYQEGDSLRKACKAEILAAVLFQSCRFDTQDNIARSEAILSVLLGSPYEYVLKNYVRVYYYEHNRPEGRRFFELLKARGMKM
ncbi:MAG TPA: ankyrin repeat domain-containing protein [Gammaproteobacteria bacterium]|jgi:hypothetical protein|nr:ankyrin repeat domain-containing protein [Gammaproteobacteria bacterium]